MPRFYFDQQDYRDPFGVDLPDDLDARRYAMRLAGDIIRDMGAEPRRFYWRMDVRDGDRREVFSVVFETSATPFADQPGRTDAPPLPASGEPGSGS